MSKETYTHIKREKENKSLLELLEIVMYGNEHKRAIGEVDQAYEDLKQALKPPTEKEVCKALSEYYGFEIMYKGLEFFPKERISSLYCVVAMVDGCIDFADPLPLYLVTLISRFYEGAIVND